MVWHASPSTHGVGGKKRKKKRRKWKIERRWEVRREEFIYAQKGKTFGKKNVKAARVSHRLGHFILGRNVDEEVVGGWVNGCGE